MEIENKLKRLFTPVEMSKIDTLWNQGNINAIRFMVSDKRDRFENRIFRIHNIIHRKQKNVDISGYLLRTETIKKECDEIEDHFINELENQIDNDRTRIQGPTVPQVLQL